MLPIMGLMAFVLLILIASLIANCYRKCPPNAAMLISGMGTTDQLHGFKIVVGGGAVVLPLIQQANYLSLAVQRIEISSDKPFLSKSGEPISISLVAEVKVKGDDLSIAVAAEQLLGKDGGEVATIAYDALLGHVQAILGTLEPQELIQSLDGFTQCVLECAIADLSKFGLTVVSLHVSRVDRPQHSSSEEV